MGGELRKEQVLKMIKAQGAVRENLLAILKAIQEASGQHYVSPQWAQLVAQELGIPLTEVYEVLTFYAMLSTKPQGKYLIEICKSAPCHVQQADAVERMLTKELGIKMGETTADGLFTLQYTSCVGACDQAPVAKIGPQIYGFLTEEKIQKIIKKYREAVLCPK